MAELFDAKLRAMRRDRASRIGCELFLYERAFDDCVERIRLAQRQFERALLIGCPDPQWPDRLRVVAQSVDVRDPAKLFAEQARGDVIVEDWWEPARESYDLVLAIGTLDSVNDFPLAFRLIRHAMRSDALLIGSISGGDTLPQLRRAMRAADAVNGIAEAHVHPRIEGAALAPLLEQAGFVRPVVDVDRVAVSYGSLERLVDDLRRMGTTNVLHERARFISRAARTAAADAFLGAAREGRILETFELLHFAAWTTRIGMKSR